jgi:uncharacterized delta-60 repeat protein
MANFMERSVLAFLTTVVCHSTSRIVLLGAIIAWPACAVFSNPGEIDPAFTAGMGAQDASGNFPGIDAAVLLTDGKMILGGPFTRFNGGTRNYIVRLNSNGSVDNTFIASLTNAVSALAILPGGKILVGLSPQSLAPGRTSLIRLNADGSPDSAFTTRVAGPPTDSPGVNNILALADGRIVITGNFSEINGTARSRIAIISPDGSIDPAFPPGRTIETGSVEALAQQPDGRILAGGSFSVVAGQARQGLARFNLDGTLDPDFAPAFQTANNFYCAVLAIRTTGDGHILAGGAFTSVNGEARKALARFKPDGRLDPLFSPPFEETFTTPSISGIEFQADRKVLVTGLIQIFQGTNYQSVVRLNSDGTLDPGFFAPHGTIMNSGNIFVQPDSAIILAGVFNTFGGSTVNGIVRLQGGEPAIPRVIVQPVSQTQPMGSRVTLSATILGAPPLTYQWNRNGFAIPEATNATLVLSNLRLDQAGSYGVIARNTYGEAASQTAMLAAVDVGAGPGAIDAQFDPQLDGPVNYFAVAPDGKIVVAGAFRAVAGVSRRGLARLNPDGSLDSGFAPSLDSSAIVAVGAVAGQRVLVATSRYPILQTPPNQIMALSPSGAVEATLDFEAELSLAGFVTSGYYQETLFHVLQDGTPIARHYGPDQNSIFRTNKYAFFALRLAGTNLSATVTNLASDLLQPRQGTTKTISTETERVGVFGPVPYVLLRRDSDRAIDPSFRVVLGGLVSPPRIGVQEDDRLLIASTGASFGPGVPQQETTLRRFRADGTLDSSFRELIFGGGTGFATESISKVLIQPGGKALIAGKFMTVDRISRGYLVRIDLGEPQPPSAPFLIAGPESADALPGQTAVFRVNPDSTGPVSLQWFFDNQPLPGGTNLILVLTNVSSASEGDYTVEVKNSAGAVRSAPARLTVVPGPGGAVDPGFDPGAGAEDGQVNALLLEPDGRVLVGGTFTKFNGQARKGLVRLNTDGSIDTTFVAGRSNTVSAAKLTVDALSRYADGRIVFGGTFQQTGGLLRSNVYRLLPDGTLDATFQASPAHPPAIMSLSVTPNGQVLLGGTFNYTNNRGIFFGESYRNLVRLGPEGNLDLTFKPVVSASQSGSRYFLPGNIRAIALLAEQNLLVAGEFEPRGIGASFARLNADASRDSSFDPRTYLPTDEIGRGGVPAITAMALDQSGDSAIAGGFLVAGASSGIARFTETGHLSGLPQSIPSNQGPSVNALAFQADGKLIAGGLYDSVGTTPRANLSRLHRDGSIDLSFGQTGSGPDGSVLAIVVEPSERILIGGNFTSVNGVARRGVARLYGSGKVYRQLLQPRLQGADFAANVHTIAGRRYVLERSESIGSPVWSVVASLNGDGKLNTFREPISSVRSGFYRLRVE